MWNINNVYKYRADNLRRMGFRSFRAYLHSDLWLSIKARVLEAQPNCQCCKTRRATLVHHRAFDPATLAGVTTGALTAACKPCRDRGKRAANEAALRQRGFVPTRRHRKPLRVIEAPLWSPFLSVPDNPALRPRRRPRGSLAPTLNAKVVPTRVRRDSCAAPLGTAGSRGATRG